MGTKDRIIRAAMTVVLLAAPFAYWTYSWVDGVGPRDGLFTVALTLVLLIAAIGGIALMYCEEGITLGDESSGKVIETRPGVTSGIYVGSRESDAQEPQLFNPTRHDPRRFPTEAFAHLSKIPESEREAFIKVFNPRG